jgi:hypothetical protein
MTEAQWLSSENPVAVLRALRGVATERKSRLYGCACCRRVWHVRGCWVVDLVLGKE